MKTQWILSASLVLLVVLVSCAPATPLAVGDQSSARSTQPPAVTALVVKEPTETPEVALNPTPINPGNKALNATPEPSSALVDSTAGMAASASQDLAKRLGVALDGIKVTAVIGQEFTREAFYCQAAKDRISNVETPESISGFIILLSAAGQRYEYHASGQVVVFCRPLSPLP
jgi:hypothetical protein